ncbi:MAG: Calx-beta domain-containing protein, partial [Acidimicrobiales bacterium]
KARTERVNVATDGTPRDGNAGGFESSAVSADGRYVAFDAKATNLVDGDTNNSSDIFVRDRRSVPGVPALSVGNATVHEGDAGTRGAVFTVSLSAPSPSSVSVGYATADGTFATATSTDYTSKSGMITFAPGATSQLVKVPVAGDTLDEGTLEQFRVLLSDPSGAFVADGTGLATILDDEPDGRVGQRLAIGDTTVHEGDAGTRAAVFNVSLSGPHTSTATVAYATVQGTATKPGDFSAKSGTLSFAPGVTSQQVKIVIGADTVPEGNESFTITLTNATGGLVFIADSTGVGTIVDND